MYDPIDDEALHQGDVVRGVYFPYFFMSDARLLTIDGDVVRRDLMPGELPPDSEAVVALRRGTGIVLSQDCDIAAAEGSPFVLVACVRPIEECLPKYAEIAARGTAMRAKWLRDNLLKLGRYNCFFYLQPSPADEFGPSVADLRDIHPVPRSDLPGLLGNRFLRLTPHAKQFLQARLAHFFGRIAVDEEHFLTLEEKDSLTPPPSE